MDDDFVLNVDLGAPAQTAAQAGGPQHRQHARKPNAQQPHTKRGGRNDDQRRQPGFKQQHKQTGRNQSTHKNNQKPDFKVMQASKKASLDDNTELMPADSDEEDAVASLVAAVAKRDAAFQQELKTNGRSAIQDSGNASDQDDVDVVEFDDETNRRKRRKFSTNNGNDSHQGASNGHHSNRHHNKGQHHTKDNTAVAEAMKQQPTKVTLAPGQLTHTSIGTAATEVFAAATPANDSSAPTGTAAATTTTPGSWGSLGVCSPLSNKLQQLSFEKPTRVQSAAIPHLLQHKDVLVRAATGSGKTLSFLVPIIQDLALQDPKISRAEGTHALIIAPTRELCLQIHDVAVQICKRFIWLVAGVLIGGEHRGHEKARLRKGITILVASPGRLIDHLLTTTSFNISQLKWLVLDEADRLLDLGFEAQLKEIVELLDQRCVRDPGEQPFLACKRMYHLLPGYQNNKLVLLYWWLSFVQMQKAVKSRTTALLSATLHTNLGALAAMSLRDPVPVGFTVQKAAEGALSLTEAALPSTKSDKEKGGPTSTPTVLQAEGETYMIPSQLKQYFMEVEAKQRLVTLAGLLRQKLLGNRRKSSMGIGKKKPEAEVATKHKAVVFIASCDGVELHHTLLGGGAWRQAAGGPLLGANVPLLKLHGDMPQAQRTAAFVTFAQAECAVLLCTDVAARGLDFPDVTLIIQYDVPGAATEYVHRVGRTARIGHAGEAVLFLMPHERPYINFLASKGVHLSEISAEGALRWLPQIAGSMDDEHVVSRKAVQEARRGPMALAFGLQRRIMQAVAGDDQLSKLAADAFRSFVRAYATHGYEVKKFFHVKNLHLGHAAFAHGMKDTPTMVGASGSSAERKRKRGSELQAKQQQARKKLMKKARMLSSASGGADQVSR